MIRTGLVASLLPSLVVPSSWVLIPAFPPTSAFVGKPNSTLVTILGPSTSALPDKFVEWEGGNRMLMGSAHDSQIALT
jgi:hypothetical protein